MTDTEDIRRVIEKALENARAAELGVTKQTEHAVRAVLQMHPELTESEAVRAVQRVMRPY
ncbi:MAG: hypothetical protein OEM59_03635 [Rhodospirillales bacterium]|nr:hypothetical protein [Rhodospirillales bacterium]